MTSKTKHPTPRLRLQAYFRLQKLTAEIQRGRYSIKDDLARVSERTPRTVQHKLRELVNTPITPLHCWRRNVPQVCLCAHARKFHWPRSLNVQPALLNHQL